MRLLDDVCLTAGDILALPIVSTFERLIDQAHGQQLQVMNSAILEKL